MKALVIVIGFMAILGVIYLIFSVLTWAVCWAFGFEFSWKLSLGVWALVVLLGAIFRKNN